MQLPIWAAAGTGEGEKTGDKKTENKEAAVTNTSSAFTYTPAATRQFASLEMHAEEVLSQIAFEEGVIWEHTDPLDSVQHYIDKARSVIGKIRETGNFVKQLDEQSLFDLPVGISKTIGNIEYTIGIASMELKTTHAELEAYMEFTTPQNGKTLTFMAKGIKFTKAGGIVGDASLVLVADYGINFNADKTQLILKGGMEGSGTFITMDCDGFKEMGIDAEVKFSRDMLVPENANGEIQEGNVVGAFKTQLSDWNDLVVQISLPDFQVTKMEGVGFSIKDAVFDFSDLRNAPAVKFPENYESTQMLPGNPNDAILTSNTIFELTTQSTSLIYGIAEPALVPGRSYAFQVRAKSIVGIEELDLFKNNGYSQVHSFTFGDACLAPTEVAVEEVSSTRIKLSWKGTFNHTAYTVSYRQANDSNAEWFQEETFFTDHTISSLEPDTEYEYQVLSACGTLPGEYTTSASIATEGLPNVELQCGLPPSDYAFDNTTPLAGLLVGDRVKAGDFSVKVTKVEGSNGTFSGTGIMVLPLMNNVKVKVKFRNIVINDEFRMIGGHMEVIGAALDLLPDELAALIDDLNETLDAIEDGLDAAEDVLEDIENVINVVTEVLDEMGDYLPDDILEEIQDAKAEIVTAKEAVSSATTPEAKDAAKAEVKKAKGKLKDGLKKGIDYYAKAIKDAIKIIKQALKELIQENKGGEKNAEDALATTEATLTTIEEKANTELFGVANAQQTEANDNELVGLDWDEEGSNEIVNQEFETAANEYLSQERKHNLIKYMILFAGEYNTTDKLKC